MADKKTVFYVLDILKRHSDEEHRLSQTDIVGYLKKEYDIKVDRKTIKTNIECLQECGYEIEYTPTTRMTPNKKTGEMEETTITSDYYLVNDFTDSELRLLIDSVLFSPIITNNQSSELIEKLSSMSSNNFKSRIKYVSTSASRKSSNHQVFVNLDIIDEAIDKKSKISYKKIIYDVEEGFRPKKSAKGLEQLYKVTPYQIAMCEGKYYLIAGTTESVIHLDLSRIQDVKILDEEAIPFRKLKEANGNSLNLKDYMNEHVFMCSGEPERIRLKIVKTLLYEVVDTFGKDIRIVRNYDPFLDIDIRAARNSVEQFLRRYTPQVTVTAPEDFQEEMAKLFAIATVATKNGYRLKKKS